MAGKLTQKASTPSAPDPAAAMAAPAQGGGDNAFMLAQMQAQQATEEPSSSTGSAAP